MAILVGVMTFVFVVSCLAIVLLVLIQPPHSDGTSGLAGAFIGAGGDSFFGTRAMSMAGKITLFLSVLIVGLAITINKLGPTAKGKTKSLMEGKGEAKPPAEAPDNK